MDRLRDRSTIVCAFSLTPNLVVAVAKRAEEEDRSRSAVVRRALDNYLARPAEEVRDERKQ